MGRSVWAAVGAVAMLAAGQAAAADVFTLQRTNGGDGFVSLVPGGFDLFGSNNGSPFDYPKLSSLTSYTATAGSSETLSFDWTYMTHDATGSSYDPGGYLLNGVQHQLSVTCNDPVFTHCAASGNLVLNLAAGDIYGFYIFSTDSQEGRGDILVKPGLGPVALDALVNPVAVPEPTAWALMITGFFGLGGMLRRRRAAAVA
jgi:hypothetical protein